MTDPKRKKERSRRGRGEGSIWQVGPNRWRGQVSVGYGANNNRIRRAVSGTTKAEVQKALRDLQGKAEAGQIPSTDRIKLADWLEHWLKHVAYLSSGESTIGCYRLAIRKHVDPYIGGILLTRLEPQHIQEVLSRMQADKKKASTQRSILKVLSMALDNAVQHNKLPRNPCDNIPRPRLVRHEIKPLDQEQAAKLLRTARGNRLEALYVLAILTGARQGELRALHWEDVDWAGSAISIRRTISEVRRGKGKPLESFEKPPKTKKGQRRIDIPKTALEALRKHRAAMEREGNGQARVFCDPEGQILKRTKLRWMLLKILKKAGLPTIRVHDLRHTHATLLLKANIHPKIVQERLGHATISETLDTYSHVLPSMQLGASDMLEQAFSGDRHRAGTVTATEAPAKVPAKDGETGGKHAKHGTCDQIEAAVIGAAEA
jgi:integrase